MPHVRSSCREKTPGYLRLELEQLYAQRMAVDAAILALQGITSVTLHQNEPPQVESSLEFSPNLCNLTNCRNA
jgi:hypothetical protein